MAILFFLFLSLIAPFLLVAGVRMIRIGRTRRIGIEPHCSKCDYLLIGIQSARCPECGTQLVAANVEYGGLQKRPAIFWGGVMCLIPFIAALLQISLIALRNVEWYKLKPTSWVISDLGTGSTAVQSRAMDLLNERQFARALSDGQTNRIVQLALAAQAAQSNSPLLDKLLEFVARQYYAGLLSPQDQQRFFQQMALLSLRVRPAVFLDDGVPYQVTLEGRLPRDWTVQFISLSESIDGRSIDLPPGNVGSTSGTGGSVTTGGSARFSRDNLEPSTMPATSSVAEHQFGFRGRLEIYRGNPNVAYTSTKLLWKQDVTLSKPFHVLAAPEKMELAHDQKLDQAMWQAIKVSGLRFEMMNSVSRRLRGEISVASPPGIPTDAALDTFVRFNQREFRASSVVIHKSPTQAAAAASSNHRYMIFAELPEPPPATVDVILRSNAKAARDTVDLTSIWDGELVYSNVPVAIRTTPIGRLTTAP